MRSVTSILDIDAKQCIEMTDKNHLAALREIRRWDTNDVISALRNNGLGECTEAVKKRKIKGEQFLELSEVVLRSWGHDISATNIRKLAALVQDVKNTPSKYIVSASFSDDAWDTDFDDDLEEENHQHQARHSVPNSLFPGTSSLFNGSSVSVQQKGVIEDKSSLIPNPSRLKGQSMTANKRHSMYSRRKITIPEIFASEKSPIKVNNSVDNAPNVSLTKVDNCSEKRKENSKTSSAKPPIPSRPPNISPKLSLKQNISSTLPKPPEFDNQGLVIKEICQKFPVEADVDEYMSIDDDLLLTDRPNDNRLASNSIGCNVISMHKNVDGPCRNSNRLHNSIQGSPNNTLPVNGKNWSSESLASEDETSRSSSPLVTYPKVIKRQDEKTSEPVSSSVDCAVTNLSSVPTKNEEKREQLCDSLLGNGVKLNNSDINDSSKTSRKLQDGHETGKSGKSEKFSNIPAEEVYEIIREDVKNCPPPLPTLPPKPYNTLPKGKQSPKVNKPEVNTSSGSLWPFGNQRDRVQLKEKVSQEVKRNTTTSSSKSNISHANELPRSSFTRPLPPPPPPLEDGAQRQIKIPLVQMPWYFNIERKKAEEMLKTCEDGIFIIRPSTQTQNPLTLTLKYGVRSFNICIRHRPDGRYALGTAKPTEQTFSSVEELVNHYSYNELLLYSNGSQAGTVILKSSPRKD